jgi:hypothetical protein
MSMKSANLFRFCIVVIMCLTTVARLSATERDKTPVAYFMDQPPTDVDAPNHLPNDAQDVTVAKVRFDQGADGVISLGGRHCEGCTDDIFGARLKIVGVRTGSAQIGQVLFVHLGRRSEHREFFAYPITSDQKSREYTVVIYLGGDGKRRLVPLHGDYDSLTDDRLG